MAHPGRVRFVRCHMFWRDRINLFTEWMSSIGMPDYITYAGSLLGYLVFTADVVCFVVFVIKEALVLIRQIVQG
jgi:hypothetical protein